MHANRPLSKREARKRWKMLTGLSAAALALHAALLSGLELAWPGGEAPSSPQAGVSSMQVRTVVAPGVDVYSTPTVVAGPPGSTPAQPALTAQAAAPPVPAMKVGTNVARVRQTPPVARATAAAAAVAPFVVSTLVADDGNVAPVEVEVAPASATDTLLALDSTRAAREPVEPAEPKAAVEEAVRVYRTRVPPAATLRFRMRRGALSGTADLAWRPVGSHYELHFDGKVAGLTIITQVSSGGIEANGLAPVRFTDQRLRHAVIAANFQRDAGKITFSGPSDEFPLWPGVQDRLSWMIQLSAIVQADAKLAQPGAKVAMHVVGARADAGTWVFRCVARESVDAAGVAVQAAKFVREPRNPYDTAAEVWLDPQRHDLPVRAALRSGDGDALELILQEVNTAP
ncbi:hypothetical protein BH11PSE8_BH11PSE8_26130 [soil metagenome]